MNSNDQILSLEERLSFYLNEPQEKQTIELSDEVYQGDDLMYDSHKALFNYKKYENSFVSWYSNRLMHHFPFHKLRALPKYEKYRNLLTLSDFIKAFKNSSEELKKASFLFYHGEKEIDGNLPFIRKARKVEDKHSVLFKLSTIRHFRPCLTAQKNDLKWQKKKTDVIWRGATTSAQFRNTFVTKYYNKYNIGFSTTKQDSELEKYKREIVSLKEQLKYKFIVSLEGYDLASNLKWILSSNSVPIMPKPTWDSWILESKLEPYVHYLPLNDQLDNLEEIMDWAINNDHICEQIAANGKKYMAQFFDIKKENEIQKKLLHRYVELFQFNK